MTRKTMVGPMIDGTVMISKSSCAASAMMGREAVSVGAPDSCCAAAMQPWLSDVTLKRTCGHAWTRPPRCWNGLVPRCRREALPQPRRLDEGGLLQVTTRARHGLAPVLEVTAWGACDSTPRDRRVRLLPRPIIIDTPGPPRCLSPSCAGALGAPAGTSMALIALR
jgi:hypothetical protein